MTRDRLADPTSALSAMLHALFFAAAALLALPALAQSDDAAEEPAQEETAPAETEADAEGSLAPVETLTPDTVVGRVGDKTITHQDVLIAAQQLGPQYQQNLSQVYPFVVQRLIDLELVTRAALAAGLDEEPVVEERLEQARQAVLRDYFLERHIEQAASEEAIAERYETFKEENPPQEEIKARHILVEEEATAKEIIGELDAGADFAELAKERSTGPSGANGGDLGYFSEGMMVEPFSDAAFALEPGSYTKTPVQTQFGWHVILVEDSRETTPPTLDEVREQLVGELQQEAVNGLLEGLREGEEIENLRDPEGMMQQN